MKKSNAIYGDGKDRNEVVTVIVGSDVVQRELLRISRSTGQCMVPEVEPSWIHDLPIINIENPLKQKAVLDELYRLRNLIFSSF
jgi:hypothetical protein